MIKACEKYQKWLSETLESGKFASCKKGPRDFVTKTDKKVEKLSLLN